MGGQEHVCNSGEQCRAFDPVAKHAYPTTDPLCRACLEHAQPAIRGLVFDYLDLAQLHEPSMSQAIAERASGSKERPIPISQHVEALQAEIIHVATTWEYELRVACHLSDPHNSAPIADWHTTLTKPVPLAKVRPGAAVQRAIGVIAPRLDRLAALPATAVCPAGIEDQPVDMCGWQAVQQLTDLHGRARAMLGRTTRRFWIPGECWACQAHPVRGVDGPLYRSEPRFEGDPMQVNCDKCSAYRAYPDYETYMATLLWPELEVAA
ncbi:hypothetical protein [Paractinoplanes maris]|uniref:hypothetical protein n=1 Tax=Paractinoplanes maris TaxID=1734446 RepID=UPI00202077FA|nr:hypothetical protein [Actinoplanes maris]